MFRRSRIAAVTAVTLLGLLAVPAGGTAATASTQLTVYAAASLTNVFPAIAPHQGAPADVFASANMTLPAQLFQQNLCSKPVVFTRNRLVIVVPRDNPAHIHNIYNLTKSGVTIDIAAKGVPVGNYTLQILQNMNLSNAVLKNVVSQETDAGFVYSTDAKTVAQKVLVVKIPAWAQPKVQYGICVVSSSSHKSAAKAFVKRVLSKAGQKKLHNFGFLARHKK